MEQAVRTVAGLAIVVALAVALIAGAPARIVSSGAAGDPMGADYRLIPQEAETEKRPLIDADLRGQTFQFAMGSPQSHQQMFLEAIANSRPEARRLVDLVDGLTTVSFGQAEGGAAGTTSTRGDGRYEVVVDLDTVYSRHGVRGVSRVVMHELGHVVDFAIVRDTLIQQLDAGIPPGYPCDPGITECQALEERFAESFAKWATGDIGVDIYLGYKVPPPLPLEQWGQPLGILGA